MDAFAASLRTRLGATIDEREFAKEVAAFHCGEVHIAAVLVVYDPSRALDEQVHAVTIGILLDDAFSSRKALYVLEINEGVELLIGEIVEQGGRAYLLADLSSLIHRLFVGNDPSVAHADTMRCAPCDFHAVGDDN